MKRNPLAALTLSGLVLLCSASYGGGPSLEKQLQADYVNKTLTLRRFYEGDHLRFLSDGRLRGDAAVGPWTLDGRIEVKEIHVKHDVVEIRGRRINVVFEQQPDEKKVFRPVDQIQTLASIDEKVRKDIEKYLRKREVTVEIELPASQPTLGDTNSAIRAVFLLPGDSMMDVVPGYWQEYFSKLEGRPFVAPSSGKTVYRVMSKEGAAGSVSAPKALSHDDPEYSDEGRRSKHQGTVLVGLVVNENGDTEDLQIQRPLGVGLDEKTIAAVKNWKFKPALKDGQAVPVAIMVETSFRLY